MSTGSEVKPLLQASSMKVQSAGFNRKPKNLIDEVPLGHLIRTYLVYIVLLAFGHVRDWVESRLFKKKFLHLRTQNGYAPLTNDFDSFYTRRLYRRLRDCWNRPTTGVASRTVTVLERSSSDYNETFEFTGNKHELINLSSYNYLGFSQTHGTCATEVARSLDRYGICVFSTRCENGNLDIHEELESLTARFLGKEASIICNMGFATNSTYIPALMGKGCLLVSDEYNHSSIVFGCRLSGAAIKTFKHADWNDLELVLRNAIAQGQPRTHRPWRKILLLIEGLYSMEGDTPDLKRVIELKRRYRFYLFIDEAHSIGALGATGRGVCEFRGISTDDVDVLMGTYTKSFGAAGGYIAGSRSLIAQIKRNSDGYREAEPMAPFVCQQIITSLRVIMKEFGPSGEGSNRLKAVYENSVYFSEKLRSMGFITLGDRGSPVIPILIVHPCKMKLFSVECMKRGLAVVVVGYPATPLLTTRARFCISASHSRDDLDYALQQIDEIGSMLDLKMAKQ